MTQKTTKYKLCLSTEVTAVGPVRLDEEVHDRLQEAFTMDAGRRYSLHAEAIAYHLRELLVWALQQKSDVGPGLRKTKPHVGLDASVKGEPGAWETERVVAVDCFLKTGDSKKEK